MTSAIEVVRHPCARGLRLSVDPATGRVRLVTPARFPATRALAWAQEQQGWIDAQRAQLPVPRPFLPGVAIPISDAEVELVWNPDAPRTPRLAEGTLSCGGPGEAFADRIERWLRRYALTMLTGDTRAIAARGGIAVDRVAIGDPRSRWGSCSSSGAIRYSWRLILAPTFVRRATVAHEVAHRVHMNHSRAFHALVAELADADPAPAYAWLRRHGAALHWIGRAS